MGVPKPVVGLILNYRDASRTWRCVTSMLNEGVTHILVWDNSDDAQASAAALTARLTNESRLSVLSSGTNLGFAAGVNRGIEWLAEQFPETWILLCNNDARLLTGGLSNLQEALTKHDQAVLAYPDIDHNGQIRGAMYYQRHTGLLSRSPLIGSFAYASGCCLLIATERISRPLLDEDFFMYGEDAELGARLGESAMVHVPKTLVHHEGSATSGLGSPFYEGRVVASHWILGRKLAQNQGQKMLYLVGRAFMLSSRALIRAFRYRSRVPLLALRDGWWIANGKDPAMHQIRAGLKEDRTHQG